MSKPLALVTGAAQRVGRAIALGLVARGWRVAAHHHNSAAAAQDMREAHPDNVVPFKEDLSTVDGPRALAHAVSSTMGPPAALVNNAALFLYDRFGAIDPALFSQLFDVNVRAGLALTDALAAGAPSAGELSVVWITDQKTENRSAQNVSYTLSKIAASAAAEMQSAHAGALDGATAARPLRVNRVGPGMMLRSGRQSDEEFARAARDNPLNVAPSLCEISAAVALCLHCASMRGQSIFIDGGLHLKGRRDAV